MRTIPAVAAFFSCVLVLSAADVYPELKTLDGKTFTQVKVMKVTPVEIRIMHSDGFATLPLSQLPPEIQSKYGTADANAEAMHAAQLKQDNMAVAVKQRQEKEALQIAEISHQSPAVVQKAVETRDWCLANPQGGSLLGVNYDAAARSVQLAAAMDVLNTRPGAAAAAMPASADASAAAPVAGTTSGPAFVPGVIQLISARYTLKADQPRNVKNRLAKLIPQGTITAPVSIQVTDGLSDAALDEGNVTTGVAAGVSTTQDGVTIGVAQVVMQAPQKNLLTVDYMYNGKRFKKQAAEGSYLVLP